MLRIKYLTIVQTICMDFLLYYNYCIWYLVILLLLPCEKNEMQMIKWFIYGYHRLNSGAKMSDFKALTLNHFPPTSVVLMSLLFT